jgi:hypothetical protein
MPINDGIARYFIENARGAGQNANRVQRIVRNVAAPLRPVQPVRWDDLYPGEPQEGEEGDQPERMDNRVVADDLEEEPMPRAPRREGEPLEGFRLPPVDGIENQEQRNERFEYNAELVRRQVEGLPRPGNPFVRPAQARGRQHFVCQVNNPKATTTVGKIIGREKFLDRGLVVKQPFPHSDHFVGVEIELEHVGIDMLDRQVHNYFGVKPDGSLREGIEFVTLRGITAGMAADGVALLEKELKRIYKGNANAVSFRCGLHIHINVMDHTMEDLYKVFMIYTVLEPLLFAVSGNRHLDNKFCVPVQKSVNAVGAAIHYSHEKSWPQFVDIAFRGNKYMAMNLKTMRNFGTLEFRHHEGTYEAAVILRWMEVLLDLVVEARKFDSKELFERIIELNTESQYDKFLKDVLPNSFRTLMEVDNYANQMYEGVAFVKEAVVSPVEDVSIIEEYE